MKNNNGKWLAIATVILLLANIVTLTLLWTQKGKAREDGAQQPKGQVFEFVTAQLQLTAPQQEEYAKLRDEHQATQRQLQDSIRSAKDDFFSLLQQTGVSDATLDSAVKKCTALDAQLDLATFKHFQKVRALCTPEQQKKFDGIIKDVLRRMGGGRPPGPPPQGRGREGMMPPPPSNGQGPQGDNPPPPQNQNSQ